MVPQEKMSVFGLMKFHLTRSQKGSDNWIQPIEMVGNQLFGYPNASIWKHDILWKTNYTIMHSTLHYSAMGSPGNLWLSFLPDELLSINLNMKYNSLVSNDKAKKVL